jgi:uncharacterized membrane protein YdjX (TVP38/TMEM64 family)
LSRSKDSPLNTQWWKWTIVGVAIIGLSLAWHFLPLGEWVRLFADWVKEKGALGVALFAGGYVLGTVFFFPPSLLNVAAGLTFGLWGFPLALASETIAAALAFLIARHLARDVVDKWAKQNEKFEAIDAAVGENGAKIVVLLRLSLLVPFSVANYSFGLTQVRFWPYVLASAIGMTPSTLVYVYLGHVGKATLDRGVQQTMTTQQGVLLGIGLAATVAVTAYLSILAKKALRKKGLSQGDRKQP